MTVQWNVLSIGFIIAFFVCSVSRWMLTQINVRHLRRYGRDVPDVFKGDIDDATLSRMTDYTVESSRFGSIEHVFDDGVTLLVLLSGFLPWLAGVILSWNCNFILSGLFFFASLSCIGGVLDLPFSLYGTFVLEKKYGFSTITFKLWAIDLIKNLLITAILMGILLGAFLALITYAPTTWWFWVWLIFAAFQLLMLWLYPLVIAPLFNKFEPVRDATLKEAIINLMDKVGLKTEGVYQIDAGKRSRHTNAYFTGMGKTKRIVLFDTLLSSHTPDEILSILAHEIGHWKKRHILKQLVFIEIASLAVFYLIYHLSSWPLLYQTFGFEKPILYVGLLLLTVILGPFAFYLTPFASMMMRKFEREADDFSFDLVGTAVPLSRALKRLAKDNLANLHPHPLYAWFYYSHPPLTERIRRLMQMKPSEIH